MKALLFVAALGVASMVSAQDDQTGSPAGSNSTLRMSNMAIMKMASALRAGKSVTITVDSRSTAYAPKLIGSQVYVPVRLFSETGQEVVWNATDMRATVSNVNGKQKNSMQYDAMPANGRNKPGKSMRPVFEKGRLWVPLASGVGAFGIFAEWVPTSNRLNLKTPE